MTIVRSGLSGLEGAVYELGRTMQQRVDWPCIDGQR